MFYSDNPVADAEKYMAKLHEPTDEKCDRCGAPICEKGWRINRQFLCWECVDELYGEDV